MYFSATSAIATYSFLVLSALVSIPSGLFGQKMSREWRVHLAAKETSRTERSIVVSLDTIRALSSGEVKVQDTRGNTVSKISEENSTKKSRYAFYEPVEGQAMLPGERGNDPLLAIATRSAESDIPLPAGANALAIKRFAGLSPRRRHFAAKYRRRRHARGVCLQ